MLRIELKLTKHYGDTTFIIKPQIGQLNEILQRCDKLHNYRQTEENPGPMTSFGGGEAISKPFIGLILAEISLGAWDSNKNTGVWLYDRV